MSTTTIDPESLRELIADALDVELSEVTDDAHFITDLGVDSLMGLELMVQFEKNYGIKVGENEFKEITSFRTAHELLVSRLAAA